MLSDSQTILVSHFHFFRLFMRTSFQCEAEIFLIRLIAEFEKHKSQIFYSFSFWVMIKKCNLSLFLFRLVLILCTLKVKILQNPMPLKSDFIVLEPKSTIMVPRPKSRPQTSDWFTQHTTYITVVFIGVVVILSTT